MVKKRKVAKHTKKSHKSSSVSHAKKRHLWGMDQDFVLIVGGGFIVVIFLMMFLF